MPTYVCAVEVEPIRAEPRHDAEQVTQALRGEPLTVEGRRGGWASVRTAYDYPGWIRAEALEQGQATLWLRATSDSFTTAARELLGSPYLWGGMTERGIDCSGLVHMAHRRIGRLVPRDADQQEEAGRRLAEHELRSGDLVTYGDADRATHIAIWLGDGRILHATDRDGVHRVVEEPEPEPLRASRRAFVRLS